MSLQLRTFSAALKERFSLNEQEMNCLIQTYQFRSQRLNEKNIISSIWDGAWKLVGRSQSDYLLDALKQRSIDVIQKHFGHYGKQEVLEGKAAALSKFVLDYLTTLNRMCMDAHAEAYSSIDYRALGAVSKMPISDAQWQHHGLHEITIDEFIDKGVYWDGERLSEIELTDVFKCIRVKYREIKDLLGVISSLKVDNEYEELLREKNALFAMDLKPFAQLEFTSSVDARLCAGNKDAIYTSLKCMREYYDLLKQLEGKLIIAQTSTRVEREFHD